MKRIVQYIAILVLLPIALHSEWEEIAPFGRQVDGAFVFVIDDIAYVGGGVGQLGVSSNFQSYNPETGLWTNLPDLPNGPRAWAFAFEANGKGYFGGGDKLGDLTDVQNDFWEYDPLLQKWTKKRNFPGVNRDACFAFSLNGMGYVGAGYDGGTYILSSSYKYNPITDSWSAIAPLPEAMMFPISFTINNTAYVGVGGQGFDKQVNSLYSYDDVTGVWTKQEDFPEEARQAASVFVHNETAYLCGGMSNFNKIFMDVFSYNPKTNQWIKESALRLPNDKNAWSVAFSIKDVAYFGTGVDFDAFIQSNQIFKYDLSISSVTEFPQTNEFKLTTTQSENNIEFTINSVGSIEAGMVDIYSIDGKAIMSMDIVGNTNIVHFNINKNNLPPLSIIRLTQGEKVYTYKLIRE